MMTTGRRLATRVTRLLAVTGICLVASFGEARAQADSPEVRSGRWLSLGLGTGVERVACDICSGDMHRGLSGFARFGSAVSPKVSLGLQAAAWTHAEEGVRRTVWSLSGLLLFRPNPATGLHFTGGLGVVGYRASEDDSALTSSSLGLNAGIGYDIRTSPSLSIAPFVQLMIAPRTDLHFNGEPSVGDARVGALQGGFSVTWH